MDTLTNVQVCSKESNYRLPSLKITFVPAILLQNEDCPFVEMIDRVRVGVIS
jgi:hypothetical protein